MKKNNICFLICLFLSLQTTIGQNLLTNGDFESGFDKWENKVDETAIATFSLESSDVNSGAGAMKLVLTQLGVNEWSVESIHEGWTSVAGTEYKLSLYAKAEEAGTVIRAIQQLEEYDASDFSLSTEWAQYEWIFQAKENNQQFKFHFYDDGIIYIDDIVIQEHIVSYPDDNTLVVNTETRFQTMEGFGGALCFYDNWVYGHPNKEEMYQLLYEDLGINLLRLRNKYRYETDFSTFDPEFIQKGEEYSDKDFKVLLCSWTPPANLKSNSNLNNGTLAKVNGEFVYQDFANYWRDALDVYQTIGVNPDWIGIQNEPDFLTDNWESCKFTPTETDEYPGFDQALDVVYNSISTLENPPLIVGAEELGIGYNNFNKYSDPIKDNPALWAYGYHLYHGGDPEIPDSYNTSFSNIATNYGDRPNIMTEYEHFDAGWFKTAWLVSNNISIGNASAYFYWNLIWPGSGLINIDNPWDVANWSNDKGYTVEPHFYAFKHFSKFIDAGYERIECNNTNGAIKSSVFLSPDGSEIVMVLLNVADHAVTTNVVPSGWETEPSRVYQSVEGNYFQYLGGTTESAMSLPSQSISTIVFGGSDLVDPEIALSPSTLSMLQGQSYSLQATVTPDDGINYAISWSSSNTSIVSVNSNGVVSANAEGNAVVTATLVANNKMANCAITVLPGGTYYSLAATANGSGTITVDPSGMLYLSGTEVALTAEPTDGWKFDSWSGSVSGSDPTITLTMDSDKEVTANFSEIPAECESYELISIPYTHGGAGNFCWEVRGEITQVNSWGCDQFIINGVDYCGQFSTEIAVPADGIYHIHYISSVGWSHVEINGTNSTGETFTLTVNSSEGGSVEPDGGTYTSGATVNLLAIPNDGYEFIAWSGDASGSDSEVSITMDDDKTVTANFQEIVNVDPTLVINVSGEGSVEPNGGTFQQGEIVTLTATPADGYYFDNWSGDVTGSENPVDLTMDADKNITATFLPESPTYYNLNIAIEGMGTVTPESGEYLEGSTVTLSATPGDGATFSGWSGDASGTDLSITITMDSDKDIVATFEEYNPYYSLNVTIDGAGTVDPTEGSYINGTEVTLTATPDDGNHFVSWGGDASGTNNPLTITMDADKAIIATFAPDGNIPCEGPVTVSVPINQNGEGEYCWFTSDDIAYVNSWNMDIVEINNVDFTNTWSSSMPDKMDGGYYIFYSAPYGWSHFEAAEVKSAGTITVDATVYPNPFTHTTLLVISEPEEVENIQVFNQLGKKIEGFEKNEVTNTMEIGEGYASGMYVIIISRAYNTQSQIITKE